jgi:hypothetical protein
MKPALWMVVASIGSWLAATRLLGLDAEREIALGMAGPLVAAVATWVMVERTYTSSQPERLTPLMMQAFAVKMVFFGVYVVVMLKMMSLRQLPFVVSFTSYFIGLHVTEALCMQRLFARGMNRTYGMDKA